MSRRKAERAFTTEGRSPFLDALEKAREAGQARSAYLNNNAQVTAKNRRHRGSRKQPKLYSDSEWQDHARNALAKGGKALRPGRIDWDASGRCQDPIKMTLAGVNHSFNRKQWFIGYVQQERSSDYPTRYLDIEVPCRKCETCLRRRAHHWRLRIEQEFRETQGRTWFCTLTLSPHTLAYAQATLDVRMGPQAWAELSAIEKYQRRAQECGKLVTKMLKRLRETYRHPIRYCLVTERHQSGEPHFHILVHEVDPTAPLRYREIARQWTKHGFFHGKLADPSKPGYMAKYLSKDASTRVRASAGYGLGGSPPQGKRPKGEA